MNKKSLFWSKCERCGKLLDELDKNTIWDEYYPKNVSLMQMLAGSYHYYHLTCYRKEFVEGYDEGSV